MRITTISLISILFFVLVSIKAFGIPNNGIVNFEIKEYITNNNKLAIVALDSLKQAEDQLKGTYRFSINGFVNDLEFHNGVALIPQSIESSTFIFVKHKNIDQSFGKYYYIFKKGDNLKTFELNGLTLLLIPLLLLFIAYIFKRFLFTFIVLAGIFLYFYLSKGLDVGQLIESVFFSLKNLIT